jgi:hypothetical protein
MSTNAACIESESVWQRSALQSQNRTLGDIKAYRADHSAIIYPKIFRAPPSGYARRSEHIAHLRSLLSVGRHWDGADALAPPASAIKATMDFVNILPSEKLGLRISLEIDGDISLFYEANGYFIDIGFDSTGLSSYYGRAPTGAEIFGDGPFEPSNPPKPLIDFIPEY